MSNYSSLYSNKTLKAASQDDAYNRVKNILKVEYEKDMQELAYVRRNEKLGEIYQVYINNTWPNAIPTLRLHEYGHILFSHFRNVAQKKKALERAVKLNWKDIKHHFTEDITQEEAADWLGLQLNNILMDFEVNSKLLTEDEYHTFLDIIDDFEINRNEKLLADNSLLPEERKDIEDALKEFAEKKPSDPSVHLSQLCWPTQYGFPLKLDYEAYVVLAMENLDKFISTMVGNMSVQMKSHLFSDNNSNQDNSQSNPNQNQNSVNGPSKIGSSGKIGKSITSSGKNAQSSPLKNSGKNNSNNSSSNSKSGKGNKNNNKNSSQDGNTQNNSSRQDESRQNGSSEQNENKDENGTSQNKDGNNNQNNQNNENGMKSDNTSKITSKTIKGCHNASYEIANTGDDLDTQTGPVKRTDEVVREGEVDEALGGEGWSRKGFSCVPVPVSYGNCIKEMQKFILKHAFAKSKSFIIRDQMYNWNRKKMNSNIIIPRDKTIEHFSLANVVVIIDVSGSVSRKSVEDTLASIENMKGNFNKDKSRLISWDTHLVSDSTWRSMHIDYSEGGTDIACGIEYAKKYLKKDNDKLFVISDFQDTLQEWFSVLKTLKCNKYGICTFDENEQNIEEIVTKHGINRSGFDEIFVYSY